MASYHTRMSLGYIPGCPYRAQHSFVAFYYHYNKVDSNVYSRHSC